MKIVCDDRIPFLKGVFEPYAEVQYLPGSRTSAVAVKDADALITRTRTRCDRDLLEGSRVKIIASATIGYDHIDTDWCEANGIRWCNAPGCNSSSVGQYLLSVLFTLARRHELRLEGMTLGVVGVGNVGSKVARAAGILGMKVLLCDPPRAEREGSDGFVSLDELIERSDIITLHVPLNAQTYHLLGRERLAGLRLEQILINSSRGEVVDCAALKDALRQKLLRAAVLDVWEGEPDIDKELMGLTDISTAHIAGYSADGKANGTQAAVRAVADVLGIEDLRDWKPGKLPQPAQELDFRIDGRGMSGEEIISEAVLYTYDVLWDSGKLRSHREDFEKLRGEYQIRREFPAYTVHLHEEGTAAAEKLEALGFNVIESSR
ncbi:MAG: 4-phosphoerythronate dehydrogenase [Candidatus Cryptobacteroides sp.]